MDSSVNGPQKSRNFPSLFPLLLPVPCSNPGVLKVELSRTARQQDSKILFVGVFAERTKSIDEMNPEYIESGSERAANWNQIGHHEKAAAVEDEMKRIQLLPATSSYASHRLRVLNKIRQLLSIQRTTSEDEELELLFAGLQI